MDKIEDRQDEIFFLPKIKKNAIRERERIFFSIWKFHIYNLFFKK